MLSNVDYGVKCAGEKITDLRYADDIDMLAESKEDLQHLTKRLEDSSKDFGMEISVEKSKVMIVGKEDTEGEKLEICVDGKKLEQFDKFTYLGATITSDGKSEKETRMRIGSATNVLANLETTWKAKKIRMSTKVMLMKAITEATLLYASESRTITKGEDKRLNAVEMKIYRRLLGITWRDRKTNEWVRQEITRR